jgi:hypothetical protein
VNGKIVGGFLVVTALVAGAAMYWLQVYAFYREENLASAGPVEIALQAGGTEMPQVISFRAIDSDSSPIRFRSCFTVDLDLPALSARAVAYPNAVPTIAPGWFDCFDAEAIGTALEKGEALAFLSQHNIAPKIDRVVAVFPDGRAYAWHQVQPETPEGIEN